MMNHRVFAKSLVAGLGAAALPSLAGAQPRKQQRKLGYTFKTM